MSREPSAADERLIHRFADGELQGEAGTLFRERLEREPALRLRLQEVESLRRFFAPGRAERPAAPAGLTTSVLAAARRLPDGFRDADDGLPVVKWCKRVLLAASVLFMLGALWHAGLFRGAGSGEALQAAPGDVERELERLDAMIRAAGATGGASAGDRAK